MESKGFCTDPKGSINVERFYGVLEGSEPMGSIFLKSSKISITVRSNIHGFGLTTL